MPEALTASLSGAARPAVDRRTWLGLVVLLLGMFMSLLDTTIVNVALQTIRTGLKADEATLSWIISGYALAFGVALIPAGRIGDRFGHKWVFIAGLTLFTLSSVACGLSQSSTELVIARVVQGIGGGMYFPAVTALIRLTFPPRRLGQAFNLVGATIGISTAVGPLAGGLLIQAFGGSDGWRSIFFVNLPIGIITLTGAAILLRPTAEGKRLSTDAVGLLLAAGALVALLVPLIEGQDEGWPLWTYLSLAGSIVLFVLFAFWERRMARGETEPLVPPRLFSHGSFTGGVILALVYFAAFSSIFFTISLLWQAGLGHTALQSGLVALPFSIGTIIGASQSDRLAQRLGRTTLSIGTGFLAVGLIALWIILLTVPTPDLVNWDLLGPLLLAGVGSGLFIAPNSRFIVATVDRAEAGAASGVIGTMQRVGSAIGIAVVGSVLFGTLPATFTPTKAQVTVITRANIQHGPAAVRDAITAFANHNLAVSFGHSASKSLAVSAAFAIAAFLLVFALPRRVDLQPPQLHRENPPDPPSA
jgi:EmrB/QacA subfamily drug resistance transporter